MGNAFLETDAILNSKKYLNVRFYATSNFTKCGFEISFWKSFFPYQICFSWCSCRIIILKIKLSWQISYFQPCLFWRNIWWDLCLIYILYIYHNTLSPITSPVAGATWISNTHNIFHKVFCIKIAKCNYNRSSDCENTW